MESATTLPPRARHVDAALVKAAVTWALPSIEAAVRDPKVSGLNVLHLVVLDPALRPGMCAFDTAILHEHSVGERQRWDADYAAFARAKARVSWLHQMDSRRLQLLEPHRLAATDAPLWGGVWLDGIVVAASGAQPQWDECFSLAIAGCIRSLAWKRATLAA